eukprot:scpid12026/ scgid6192/ 
MGKEYEEKLADVKREAESVSQAEGPRSRLTSTSSVTGSGTSHTKRATNKMPKYDNRQSITMYLELFEDVATQNGFTKDEWLIRLRVAVVGTRLEKSCKGCRRYDDAKRELLLAFGKTPEKAWRALTTTHQNPEESFYQFCVRIAQEVCLWAKLTGGVDCSGGAGDDDDGEADDDGFGAADERIMGALIKQLVLEAGSPELKAFMLERKCYSLTFADFQAAGTSYQEAHGRARGHASKPKPALEGDIVTAKSFRVTVDAAERALGDLEYQERQKYVNQNWLCRNCLRWGHRQARCNESAKCNKCKEKHHPLLHPPGRTVNAVSFRNEDVRLMTAVVKVVGPTGSRKVRAFVDPGSQASFVSTALVSAVGAKTLSHQRVRVQAFGHDESMQSMSVKDISLVTTERTIKVEAFEQESLSLSLPKPSAGCVQRWKERGIALSDVATPGVSDEIHLMIGADHAFDLFQEKRQSGGETVWRTDFGWLIVGPVCEPEAVPGKSATRTVGVVQSQIDRLWEMEAPVGQSSNWPAFPIAVEDGRFKVGLLWASEERPPDNRWQALAAANAQLKKLGPDTPERQRYDAVLLAEYMALGAVEVDPDPEQDGYYMPHHAVFKAESTTTKVRVVFNASAALKGRKSLNDVLDPGPSLLPSISGLLLRFREREIAMQADIRKAFFMVGLEEADRRYVRFLWPNEKGEMTTYRLTRLPFGVNCSPFILTAILQHHLDAEAEQLDPKSREQLNHLRESLYVDDCVASASTPQEADEFRAQSVHSLSTVGMDLRKWRMSTDEAAEESKVLGCTWTVTDELCFPVGKTDDVKLPWTKRTLLKAVASIYDPLGFVSPYSLQGKILMQELWKLASGWDQPLSAESASIAIKWWQDRHLLPSLCFPRWLGDRSDAPAVHLFCDASELGYGCCIYYVFDGVSRLVFAKSKVSPLKAHTLARMELQAAFIGARCLQFVLEQSSVSPATVHAWSDSMTVIQWLAAPPYRWKTYVSNRVSEIQAIAKQHSVTWLHCPGADNPADIASRGASVTELMGDVWQQGPAWLRDGQWPRKEEPVPTDESQMELHVKAVLTPDAKNQWWLRLSKWTRVQGVVRRMLSWKYKDAAVVSAKADQVLLRAIQEECFPAELSELRNGRSVPKSSKIGQFSPFLDNDGLIRATLRLQFADLDPDTTHPVLLAKHYLTRLMLTNVHVSRLHQGVEACLAFVRRRYLIVGGRRMLRAVKEKCVVCRRADAPTASERAAPLPADRVLHQRPFCVVGVDHAGPLLVKDRGVSSKVWILLFVCATTRAVHLELVESLSEEEFLLAYRRFVARFGKPTLVRSDNGTAFAAASRRLVSSVDWRLNAPAAPWHGGFFERLVAIVKSPLRRVLGKSLLSKTELRTLLSEVQDVVNDRPITYVTEDEDLPLSPSMLLGAASVQSDSNAESCLSHTDANRRLQYLSQLRVHFTARWTEEYLLSLRSHHDRKGHSLAVGDVVFLADHTKKRVCWKLARILQLHTGRDGRQRVAKVRVSGHELLRPIQRLVPLEISSRNESPTADADSEPEDVEDVVPTNRADDPEDVISEKATLKPQPQVQQSVRTRTRLVQRPQRYRE